MRTITGRYRSTSQLSLLSSVNTSPIRCINLDWLEVFCMEPSTQQPYNSAFFREQGWMLDCREYGTRIYHEMFTLLDKEGLPLLEVRRNPKNPLMPTTACHLRLHNRTCYLEDAASFLQQFIDRYHYVFCRISRVDICMDFVRFDDNTKPRVFMQRYMRGKFSKINQANIHSHGTDSWTGRVWNSVSWGSPSSMVGTKFYNKTLELYDPKHDSYSKPYIRYAWLRAGLIDDMDRVTLNNEKQEIWRVEFSVKSSVKKWFVIELNGNAKNYQSIHNTLDCYDSKAKLIAMFASLSCHYFKFKRYIMGKRKDLCPDRRLFNWQTSQTTYSIDRTSLPSSRTPSPQLLMLIKHLKNYLNESPSYKLRGLIMELLKVLQELQLKEELEHPWKPDELLALQETMARRSRGITDATYTVILEEVKALLRLNDKTAIF